MVHVIDEGVFDEPIDKIWRFLADDKSHQHAMVKTTRVIEQSDKGMTAEIDVKNPDGSWRKETWNLSFNPPTSFGIEVTSGLTKGTKHKHTYTPMGAKTKVVVEGEFVGQGMDDAALKKTALAMFEQAFIEDAAQLKKFK